MQKIKQGISLVVLVVTIIIMIILAGSVILSLNDTDIIQRADDVVDETNQTQIQDLAKVGWLKAYVSGKRTQAELEEAVDEYLKANGVSERELNNYYINVTTQDVTVRAYLPNETPVSEEWKDNVTIIVDGVPIPKGFVASRATGENTKAEGLVIYEGTEEVTDSNVEWAKRNRNQYVWVPVETTNFQSRFIRQNFEESDRTSLISNTPGVTYWEVALDDENMPLATQDTTYMSNTTITEAKDLYESVKEYEGFYIARYEAGIDVQREDEYEKLVVGKQVYSRMGKIPYTYISWSSVATTNIDTGGAAEVARSIYSKNNTKYGVVSTLTYGVQFSAILKWWEDTNAVASLTNSTGYGNFINHEISTASDLNDGALVWDYNNSTSYVSKTSVTYPKSASTSWVLSTGALKVANVKNIYDLAGNIAEWTMEGYNEETPDATERLMRGRYFIDNGEQTSVISPLYASAINSDNQSGFRIALYIKK